MKKDRRTGSWLRWHPPSTLVDLSLSTEEILRDLDPGWANWTPTDRRVAEGDKPAELDRPGEAA